MKAKIFDIAVVGCGNVSRMHFKAYTAHPERVRVAAACDPLPGKVKEAQETYGFEQGFASLEEMIEKSDWEIGVVCTPTPVRKDTIEMLAKAGKHVFVEKPLAELYAEARDLVEICERAGVTLAVNQNFRYHYPFDWAKKVVERGAVGNIVGISHQDLSFRQDAGWRTESERHSLSVMGVHWFDGFRWVLGDEAKSIVCETRSSSAIDCVGDTDATVQLVFEGGTIVSYTQSFSSLVKRTDTIVIGDQGAIALDYQSAALFDRASGAEPVERWVNPYSGANKPEASFKNIDLLCTSLEEGSEPPHSGRDNLKTITLLDAAYRSAEAHTELQLNRGAIA